MANSVRFVVAFSRFIATGRRIRYISNGDLCLSNGITDLYLYSAPPYWNWFIQERSMSLSILWKCECVHKGKIRITIDEIKQPKLNALENGKYFQIRSVNSFATLFDTCINHKAIDYFMILSECQQRKKNQLANKKKMKTNKTIIVRNRVSHLNNNKRPTE